MDLQSNRFKSGAKRLIDKHGKTRVYKSIGSETYNRETQTVETTSTLYTIKMFETEPKYKEVKSPNLVGKKLTVFLISTTDLPVRPKVGEAYQRSALAPITPENPTLGDGYFREVGFYQVVLSYPKGEGVGNITTMAELVQDYFKLEIELLIKLL